MDLSIKRHSKIIILVILNILIFIGLVIGSIYFQFLFLGRGASTNSQEFNLDIAPVVHILILLRLVILKKNRMWFIVFFIISLCYLTLKFIV